MKNKVLIALFASMFIFCSGMFLKEYIERDIEENKFEVLQSQVEQNQIEHESIEQSQEMVYNLDNGMIQKYSPLYEQNNDIIGWIKIDNTNINYPVMQTKEDEQFYLRRNFEKEYSIAGTPFLSANSDVEETSSQTIIYGHNMNNDTMFSDLHLYESESFLKENNVINFDTLYKEQTYEIFAVFKIDTSQDNGHFRFYDYTKFKTQSLFTEFLNEISEISLHPIEKPPQYNDNIITMITCDIHSSSHRFVAMAKLVK